MGDPDAARTQRRQANDARIDKKRKEAEAKKRAAAAKRAQKNLSAGVAVVAPQTANDVFSTPGVPSNASTSQPKRKRPRPDGDVDEPDDEELPSCLHPDDPANFLKLGRAMRILVSREITEQEIEEADALLREYTSELVEVSPS
jgi:hypothetical protein